ncbi:hypothetical protein GGF46_003774 [Coemansia sp. RSA 552]|nr:hypothetical protein GGF46_003774 [Coemansia sp. RSA 552]
MASLMRESHPLALKVMRLSRPSLAAARPLPVDSSSSVLATAVRDAEQRHPAQSGEVLSDTALADTERPLDGFPLTETLELPRAFGTMFLGETFAAQMCVSNDSPSGVRDVAVKVVMQTATQQLALAGGSAAAAELGSGQALSLRVEHEIKELGTHMLGCAITYVTAQGERRTLQRSFRFQAGNPLVVKTKVNHIGRAVLLEVQVHNATHGAMALERLRFDPVAPFVAEELGGPALWGSRAGFMGAGDVRQYLYRLQAAIAEDSGDKVDDQTAVEKERALQYATALGRLDILWRGAFGSTGRLQTSPLVRRAPGMFLIETEGAHVVGSAAVERPFEARVRVRNVSEQAMTLTATALAQRHPLVMPCGAARTDLGSLGVGETRELRLEFLPLAPGVQQFGALALHDSVSGYTRELDHLLDVFVGPQ